MGGKIGQIVPGGSYLERISKLIFEPIVNAESATILWPAGMAKTDHILEIFSKKNLSSLGGLATKNNFYFLNLSETLEISFEGFVAFVLGFFQKKFPKHKFLTITDVCRYLISQGEVTVIISQLDLYEESELKKIVYFLDKLSSQNPFRLRFQIHFRNYSKYINALGFCPQSRLFQNLIEVPLPTKKEALGYLKQMVLTDKSQLKISQVEMVEIVHFYGPVIATMKNALREIRQNPKLLENIPSISRLSTFELKKKNLLAFFSPKIISQLDLVGDVDTGKSRGRFKSLPFLSDKENRLIAKIVDSRGKVITRDQIAQILWGKEESFDKYSDWAINKYISRLRKKLKDNDAPSDYVVSKKGRGFYCGLY